jgi:hypothetical protein
VDLMVVGHFASRRYGPAASIPNVAVLAQASGRDGPFVDAKRNPEAAEVPGVAILRVESPLLFTGYQQEC